jgi:hypothetical protein
MVRLGVRSVPGIAATVARKSASFLQQLFDRHRDKKINKDKAAHSRPLFI